MSDQGPIQSGAPAAPQMVPDQGNLTELMTTLGDAADVVAKKAQAAEDARDTKDYAQAALFLAQALSTLDPSRIDGGNDPEAVKASVPDPPPPTKDGDHDGKVGS